LSRNGLSREEASARLQRDGPNKVEGAKGLSVWKILLRQVSNSLTLVRSLPAAVCWWSNVVGQVLAITMAISFGIHDFIEAGVITAVISLNIVVG
jgi:P-type Na+/K+ transporter